MANSDYLISPDQVQEEDLIPIEETKPTTPSGVLGTPPPSAPVFDITKQFFSGSLPPQFQLDSNFSRARVESGRIPKASLMPFGLQSNPSTNAAVQSTATKVVVQAIAAIPPAPPAATSVTDGLVHGDKIWAVDPAYVILRDDFVSSSTGVIGQLGWSAFGGITGSAYESGTSAANIGEWSWSNDGVAGHTGGIMLFPAASTGTFQFGLPILDFPGWKAIFIWRFNFASQSSGTPMSFAQKSMYIGFAFGVPQVDGAVTRPNIFIGARYDTDTTAPAISDSKIKLEAVFSSLSGSNARNNTQGIVVDTGETPVMDKYYRLEITCIASGVVTMSLNGSAPSTFNLSPMVVTAAAGSTHQASVGLARMTLANTNGKQPWFAGSLVTIAGDTATFNGLHTTNPLEGTNNGIIVFASGATVGTAAAVGWTATGFPALFPIFNWGNDTVAAPTSDTRILVDYFGFVWNKGLAGATNPTATLPRYW